MFIEFHDSLKINWDDRTHCITRVYRPQQKKTLLVPIVNRLILQNKKNYTFPNERKQWRYEIENVKQVSLMSETNVHFLTFSR